MACDILENELGLSPSQLRRQKTSHGVGAVGTLSTFGTFDAFGTFDSFGTFDDLTRKIGR